MIKYLLLILTVSILYTSHGQPYNWGGRQINSGDTIVSYEIVFDLAKWDIIDLSKPFLDSLASFLKTHSEIKIDVINHCDFRTSEELFLLLTQRRAEAIKEYLVESGIDETRIIAIGHHDEYPVFNQQDINEMKTIEEKEKAHAMNRRTEIIFKTQPNTK